MLRLAELHVREEKVPWYVKRLSQLDITSERLTDCQGTGERRHEG